MKKSKFAASIVDKIQKEKIEQHSRLYFFAKFSLILLGAILFLIIGVIAAAVIWHFFHDTELLEIFSVEKRLFFKALLFSFPVFWLIISISLGIFAGFFARNTKKGYKISYKVWLILIILFQIGGGLALEQSPLGNHLEKDMMRQIHIFKSREKMFNELWQNPEKGLLIGEIFDREKDKFTLYDLNNKEWEVSFDGQKVETRGDLKKAKKVRIFGKKLSDDSFFAKRIVGPRFDFERPPRRPVLRPPREELEQGIILREKRNPTLQRRNELMNNVQDFHKEQLGF